jgi:large subunit ribosomal protein L30
MSKAKNVTHIFVTQVRGMAGKQESHKLVIKGLGLRRVGHSVQLQDTPAIRGMIEKVHHLVSVQVRPGAAEPFGARSK